MALGVTTTRAIPTCVGTTLLFDEAHMWLPGHPHMRGDYARYAERDPALAGPSPHAWGLR